MGKLRKIGKKIARGIRKIGRKLKKGLGKIAKAFGKLGPIGSLALSFILPGIGTWLTTGPMASFFQPIFNGISRAGKFLKDGVGRVFNKVTDVIEAGMNTVSKPFMKEGARGAGSAFRDFVSDVTGGFISPSKEANLFDKNLALKTKDGKLLSDMTNEELDIFTKTEEFKTLKASTDLGRSQTQFLKDNLRTVADKEGFKPSDLNLKEGEVVSYNEATKQYDIFKNQDAYDAYASGDFDTSVGGLTPEDMIAKPEKSSLLSGKEKGQSTREFIKDSKEYSVYKKVAPISTFGTAMVQNEADIAAYNASLLEQQQDYFGDFGQSFLQSGTDQSFGGARQQNFVDVEKFTQSPDIITDYLKNIYGTNIIGSFDNMQDKIRLAQQANPYGFQLTDI